MKKKLVTILLIGSFMFVGIGGMANATPIDIGTLPTDGSFVIHTEYLASSELDYYSFMLMGDINNGDGTYLNIQTYGQEGFNPVDTEIGLYDGSGFLVADDDGNADDPYTYRFSLLTFGDSDPYGTNVVTSAGEDGLLSSGSYTLVVGSYNTIFTADINDIIGGKNVGDYNLQFSSVVSAPVPEPSTILLLGSGLLGLVGYNRKRFSKKS